MKNIPKKIYLVTDLEYIYNYEQSDFNKLRKVHNIYWSKQKKGKYDIEYIRNDFQELTQKQTDEIFDSITIFGCREMDELRFNQAVNEILHKYFRNATKYKDINDLRKDYDGDVMEFCGDANDEFYDEKYVQWLENQLIENKYEIK